MFDTNYYCLVAGLREYSLDGGAKGFDPHAILDEILRELTPRDLRAVRLLYGYYDCKNLIALRAGSPAHDPLGNFSQTELREEMEHPRRLPQAIGRILRAYASPEGEDAETVNTDRRFEMSLYEAYYEACEASSSRFLQEWSRFDRTLRNVAAAITARATDRPVGECIVGRDDIAEQLRRSSAADFGLRGELPYIDAVIAAVNDEGNLLEKEHRIDRIRWQQAVDLAVADYFDINAILSYLVRINIVARWAQLDEKRGREMLGELLRELDGKELINNN